MVRVLDLLLCKYIFVNTKMFVTFQLQRSFTIATNIKTNKYMQFLKKDGTLLSLLPVNYSNIETHHYETTYINTRQVYQEVKNPETGLLKCQINLICRFRGTKPITIVGIKELKLYLYFHF